MQLARTLWLIIALIVSLAVAADRAQAQAPTQPRYALVIGVSAYEGRYALANAGRDAALVASRLSNSGFDAANLKLLTDPTKGQIRDALDALYLKAQASPNALIVIYYAGHAVQYEGINYLVPKGADLLGREVTPGDYDDQGFNAQLFLSKFARTRVGHLLVILDACRDNPFGGSPGLAEITGAQTGPEWMVAFSAMAGQTASDGTGQNSPYTAALAHELAAPDITLTQVFERVQARFAADPALARQRPYAKGSLNVVLRTAPSGTDLASLKGAITSAGGAMRGGGGSAQMEVARLIGADRIGGGEDGRKLLNDALKLRPLSAIRADAEKGDAFALYLLALAHWDGVGGASKDVQLSAALLRRSVARGSGRAASSLGVYLCCDAAGPKNDAEAVEWFRVGSWLKFAGATRNLGISYRDGSGVKKDLAEAIRLLELAGNQGDTRAWSNIGWLYNNNDHGLRDKVKARGYFQKAVDSGDLSAVIPLANGYWHGIAQDGKDKEPRKALEILVGGGTAGCGECWYNAGQLFGSGDLGAVDEALAYNAFMKGAELGDANAMLEAARKLGSGKGVAKNPVAAFAMYERAAAAGSVEAKGSVGLMLARGEGVTRNPVRGAAILREVLARDLSADPKVRHAVYQPNYWGYARDLGILLDQKLVPERSATELAELRKRYGPFDGSMKRFTVPIDCAGIKSPFHVYVLNWDRPNDETPVDPQAEWLQQERGCSVPADVLDAFRKLKKIARENNVSFIDLTVYALGAAQQEQATQPQQSTKPEAKPQPKKPAESVPPAKRKPPET
ncbi:DUF2610 domain-containing protein [Sphingomonas sp.]|uniref:DUF2610 domain-containing protein n=1 Tax=Sphingomonas sp. TaxID=28214 RepID=UPI0017CACA6A|nr:DUF2610 domain-containing protein [Sphingomonas sp.]MBA4763359.1 DUF2610 domain-containing protein [Sphingomonas sp.]